MAEIDVLRVAASLLSILALIFILAWLVRRAGFSRGNASQPMQLISRQSLGPRAHLAIVQVGGKQLILGVTAQQITLLDTLPTEAAQSLQEQSRPSFAQSLKTVLQRGS